MTASLMNKTCIVGKNNKQRQAGRGAGYIENPVGIGLRLGCLVWHFFYQRDITIKKTLIAHQ